MTTTTLITKSTKSGRSIELNCPEILLADSLAEIVNIQGESATIAQANAQLTIAFRAKIRGLLETTDDNDDPKYSDDDILAMDFTDWKPAQRTRKSAEDKAMEAIGNLTPEALEAVLANYKANQA